MLQRPFLVILSNLWITGLLPSLATGQEILPSLDLADQEAALSFVPGEIIVKLKDTPGENSDQESVRGVEPVAFSEQLRPLGGGAFVLKLDTQLFTAQAAESMATRTAKVAHELAQREDIVSSKPDGPGEVIVRPADRAVFEEAIAAGEFETIIFEGQPRRLPGGNYALKIDEDLISPQGTLDLRERTLQALEEIRQRPDVEYAQLNYIATPVAKPRDPRFENQWNFFNNGTGADESLGGINLEHEWDQIRGSRQVVVAVIDTGIVTDHPDLRLTQNLVLGFDMISKDSVAADSRPGRDDDPRDEGDGVAAGACGPGSPLFARPDSWHGTHVAGIVGAAVTDNEEGIAGVNWEVKVQPIRVLGKCGGDIGDINAAIRYAAGLEVPGVLPNPTPARVINLSLRVLEKCSQFPDTQAAINAAVFEKQVTVVVAAGNERRDAADVTPAGCNNVITVAASDARGHLAARYSNFGDRIAIMAPGGDVQRDDNQDNIDDGILSTVKGGYQRQNGTSMAAPHVAGVVALMLSLNSSLTPARILEQLQRNAIPRTAIQCPKKCGAGLLNAFFPDFMAASPTGEPSSSAPADER